MNHYSKIDYEPNLQRTKIERERYLVKNKNLPDFWTEKVESDFLLF